MKEKFLVLILVALAGCSKPVGPAEQIGRGIDQIATGLMEMDRQQAEREAEYRRKYPPTPVPYNPTPDPYYYSDDDRDDGSYNDRRRY